MEPSESKSTTESGSTTASESTTESKSTTENQSKDDAEKKAFNSFVANARAIARKKRADALAAAGGASAQAFAGATGATTSNYGATAESAKAKGPEGPEEPEEQMVCCKGVVHITYRGIADDRVYISYSRLWNEIRYFRPHGLKVFCAECRSRVL